MSTGVSWTGTSGTGMSRTAGTGVSGTGVSMTGTAHGPRLKRLLLARVAHSSSDDDMHATRCTEKQITVEVGCIDNMADSDNEVYGLKHILDTRHDTYDGTGMIIDNSTC